MDVTPWLEPIKPYSGLILIGGLAFLVLGSKSVRDWIVAQLARLKGLIPVRKPDEHEEHKVRPYAAFEELTRYFAGNAKAEGHLKELFQCFGDPFKD